MAYNYDIPFHVDLTDRVALVTGGNGGIWGAIWSAAGWSRTKSTRAAAGRTRSPAT